MTSCVTLTCFLGDRVVNLDCVSWASNFLGGG